MTINPDPNPYWRAAQRACARASLCSAAGLSPQSGMYLTYAVRLLERGEIERVMGSEKRRSWNQDTV